MKQQNKNQVNEGVMEISKLSELRNKIDEIDQLIIPLLATRFHVTEQIGIYKTENHLSAQDSERESNQFRKIVQMAQYNGLNPDYALEIYRCVMNIVISRHKEIKQLKSDL